MSEPDLIVSAEQVSLFETLRTTLADWRKFTIAIDGYDGSGKSTLARYLSWRLEMPAIELDLLYLDRDGSAAIDATLLKRLIAARHDIDRPVIVEGIMVLRALAAVDITPDYVIYVDVPGHEPSFTLQEAFAAYERDFSPRSRADLVAKFKP